MVWLSLRACARRINAARWIFFVVVSWMIDWGVVSLVATVMGVVNVGGYYYHYDAANREARKLK